MKEAEEAIDKKIIELNQKFDLVKQNILQAEKIIVEGKRELLELSGAFKTLKELKKALEPKIIEAEVVEDE